MIIINSKNKYKDYSNNLIYKKKYLLIDNIIWQKDNFNYNKVKLILIIKKEDNNKIIDNNKRYYYKNKLKLNLIF